ncbi:MAG TPA: hypothetical protein VFZ61_03675 [Polyangiales bacterium]
MAGPSALVIGMEPELDEGGDAPEAGPGELATEAFCKAKDAGDYAAAWSAFQDMLAAAKDGEPTAESAALPL